MTRKPAPKPDDPEQAKRFAEMARQVEADEKPDALERALKNLDLSKKPAIAVTRLSSKRGET